MCLFSIYITIILGIQNDVTITAEENLAYMVVRKINVADNNAYASYSHQSNHIYDQVL